MTIETHLHDLSKKTKDGTRIPKDFDAKTLADTVIALDNLQSANIKTPEGLKIYESQTGRNYQEENSEEVEYYQKAWTSAGTNFLEDYAHSNFDKLTKTLGEETQLDLAFRYSPEGEINGSQKYDKTKTEVSSAKKTIRTIQENPDEFMKGEIEESSAFVIPFILENKEEYMGIMQRKAIQDGTARIINYDGGAKKYIDDTESHITNMSKEFPKLMGKLKDLEGKRRMSAIKVIGRALNVQEENEILKDLREKETVIKQDYAAIGSLQKLHQEVIGTTVSLTLQKEAEKAVKKSSKK